MELERITHASAAKHQAELDKAYAYELSQKVGVDMKDLLKCKTQGEMDKKVIELTAKAKDDEVTGLKAKVKAAEEAESKKQKIASGVVGGAGFGDLSASGKLEQGFKDKSK